MYSETAPSVCLLHVICAHQRRHLTLCPFCISPKDCMNGTKKCSDISAFAFNLKKNKYELNSLKISIILPNLELSTFQDPSFVLVRPFSSH